jgi:hypothetical protein
MGWVVSVTPRPRFTPGERTADTHWTGGWVGPRAGLNTEVRGTILLPLPGIEPRLFGRPLRSQTLYWLSYPSSPLTVCLSKIFRHWVTEAEWSYVTPAFPHGLEVVNVGALTSNKMPITVWICRLTAIYCFVEQVVKSNEQEVLTWTNYATPLCHSSSFGSHHHIKCWRCAVSIQYKNIIHFQTFLQLCK